MKNLSLKTVYSSILFFGLLSNSALSNEVLKQHQNAISSSMDVELNFAFFLDDCKIEIEDGLFSETTTIIDFGNVDVTKTYISDDLRRVIIITKDSETHEYSNTDHISVSYEENKAFFVNRVSSFNAAVNYLHDKCK